MNFSISLQLKQNAQSFRADSKFIDCVIHSGDREFPSHRIFLAKFSQWFHDFFTEQSKTSDSISAKVIDIEIPLNTESCFGQVLDALYGKDLHISINNAPAILKIVTFYGISIMKDAVIKYIRETTETMTVLYYIKKFIEYELFDQAIILTPFIAKSIKRTIKYPNETHVITMKDVLKNVTDGRIFAMILKDKKLKELSQSEIEAKLERRKAKSMEKLDKKTFKSMITPKYDRNIAFLSQEQKVALIDEFVSHHEINQEERNALASVIDWARTDVCGYLLKYNCDWAPYNVQRNCIKKIIKKRRKNIKNFEDKCELHDVERKMISRVFPLAYIPNIYYADDNGDEQNYDLVKRISLYGDNKEIDLLLYGIAKVEHVGDVFNANNEASCVLRNDNSYFIGYGNDETSPGVVISFDKLAAAKIKSLTIDTKIEKNGFGNSDNSKYYLSPKSLIIEVTDVNGNKKSKAVEVPKSRVLEFQIDELSSIASIRSIKIMLDSESKVQILRIKHVTMNGYLVMD